MRTFPFKLFFICFLVLALILFCFPLNLFDGEIVIQHGLQKEVIQAPLSLSYFVGLGYNSEDLKDANITDFYLLPTGYLLAAAFLLGVPFVIALRRYLKK